jgi:predicted DNA-binding transcriptional regulator AlpA
MIYRPPSYLSCASLARELDMSESTVQDMVRRGVLPKPVRLSNGCVRWSWADVQASIGSLSGVTAMRSVDPYMAGVSNVASS